MLRLTLPLGLLLVLSSGACTARYQDLLRTRDAEIMDKDAQLSDLRATNDDLQRRLGMLQSELDQARKSPVVEAAADKPDERLERVRNDLDDLDVRYRRGRLSIGIDNSVTFSAGSTALKGSAGAVLRRVADVVRREYPSHRIYVEGHTDTDPIAKTKGRFRSNRHLSAERADRVAEFLVAKCGVPADRIVVVGYGPFDPRDAGTSTAAKGRNRRVEVVVGDAL